MPHAVTTKSLSSPALEGGSNRENSSSPFAPRLGWLLDVDAVFGNLPGTTPSLPHDQAPEAERGHVTRPAGMEYGKADERGEVRLDLSVVQPDGERCGQLPLTNHV
jgi:hypothetical protein